ncbi:protocadherin-like wing polarity protein stan [Dermacentor variabilis]|uniref:protocadherin-like wing polarity protein stan n=1 Tax=Dermacentor variabilis TaxID=34621 RepID=UPI003F5BB22D
MAVSPASHPRTKRRKPQFRFPGVGWLTLRTALLLIAAPQCQAQTTTSNQDNLCYLTHGGSSETFTVNEAFPVESIVGRLQVVGNASEPGGDIQLRMADPEGSPLTILPGTKSLVLRRKLDKEGRDGLRSVTTDVICSPRHTRNNDHLSITVPVRIIVTDANDNAPEFQGTPYFLNISESTVPGTTVMQGIRAVDKDQPGLFSTVEYFVDDGPHSHLLAFENRWEGSLLLMDKLDHETLPKFTITLRAQDQGNPPQSSHTTLVVVVHDADDQNPRFKAESYFVQLHNNTRMGAPLDVKPSKIEAEDPDEEIKAPIKYTFNSDANEYSYFDLHPQTGHVSLVRPLPEGFALPVTLVVRATQHDNPDRFALTTLTLTADRFPPHELHFLQEEYEARVMESTPPGQTLLTMQTTRSAADKGGIRFELIVDGNEGEAAFTIHDSGELILAQSLDYETKQFYALKVLATDGKHSDVARVNVSVLDVNDNDPQFSEPRYSFTLTDLDAVHQGSLVGRVEASDADAGDSVQLAIDGPSARLFTINNQGEVRIRDLEYLNSSRSHLVVVATDSGVPPRKSTALVEVQFPEALVLRSSALAPRRDEGSFVLMTIFGALLGSLLLIIITLTLYILKNKKFRNRLPVSFTGNGHTALNKVATIKAPRSATSRLINPPRPLAGVENPIFNLSDAKSDDTTEDMSERETLPDCLDTPVENGSINKNNGLQRNGRALPNGRLEPLRNGMTAPLGGPSLLYNGKLLSVQWPIGSIPMKVKELNWEDDQPNKTALDPDFSVTPLTTGNQSPSHNELTVYF